LAGLFSKLRDALSVEEVVRVPQKRVRPRNLCSNCLHWCAPEALTSAILGSARAVSWAKDNGYGRCQAPGRGAADSSDKKRFTKPDAGCELWAEKAAKAMAAPSRAAAARKG
jgi:hypothetical protein